MTTPQLEAIRRREREASPGPWEKECSGDPTGENPQWDVIFVEAPGHGTVAWMGIEPKEANAEFIAHARQDIKDLLALVDELREEARAAGPAALKEFARVLSLHGQGECEHATMASLLRTRAAALRQGEGN